MTSLVREPASLKIKGVSVRVLSPFRGVIASLLPTRKSSFLIKSNFSNLILSGSWDINAKSISYCSKLLTTLL